VLSPNWDRKRFLKTLHEIPFSILLPHCTNLELSNIYAQRGAATTVRMRGWVLIALARAGVPDAALLFVLEELDAGVDPYLVAAAARALRSYPSPSPAFAPFVTRALTNIRYRDEPVSFENYGEYAVSSTGTSPVRELLSTLTWLGPHAHEVLHAIESLRGGISKKLLIDLDRAVETIRAGEQVDAPGTSGTCCTLPRLARRRSLSGTALLERAPDVSVIQSKSPESKSVIKNIFQRINNVRYLPSFTRLRCVYGDLHNANFWGREQFLRRALPALSVEDCVLWRG